MTGLDARDIRILKEIQSDFPVCKRPFERIAEKLGISEKALIQKVRRLCELGIIRRFGAVFESRRLGYESTLIAVRIPDPACLPAIAIKINSLPEVTHNYQRDNRYNLWFTLIAATRARIGEILEQVARIPGVAEVRNLPSEEVYKIRAVFGPLSDGK
ncbi:MAG: AsnC family transcriptional regulator [Gemmatimonadota bacterium]|nr:AsnC family transcriptional regulator [Gemmatimonadota bacterium]